MRVIRTAAAAVGAGLSILLGCAQDISQMSAPPEAEGVSEGGGLCATFRVELWPVVEDLDCDNDVTAHYTGKKVVANVNVAGGRKASGWGDLPDNGCVTMNFTDMTVEPGGVQARNLEFVLDYNFAEPLSPTNFRGAGHVAVRYPGERGRMMQFPVGKVSMGPEAIASQDHESASGRQRLVVWRTITLVSVGPRKT